jgi:methylenetetrahydrofolate reductase (NADPH)
MTLEQRFDSGEFVIVAEMEPPKGVNVGEMVGHAKRVKDRVAAFLVPEMNHAVMRMSALGGAMVLREQGMEPIMQICCRDRNRLALQGDLLGAGACGIRNLVVVGGEDPSFGDHHQARAVHDITPLELLKVIQGLQGGRDMAGVELNGSPKFLVGADHPRRRPRAVGRARSRGDKAALAAGARFFITPPVFDPELIAAFMRRVDPQRTIVLPTVLLLKSLGMARYIERNMPHIFIPPEIIDRIQRSPEKVRECVRIVVEMVARLKAEGFKGVMISTLGWEHKLPDIVEAV